MRSRCCAGILLAGLMTVPLVDRIARADGPDPGLGNLYQTRDAISARASSSAPDWQDGNGDARPIPPGQTLTIADLDGPGVVRHIWFTINAQDPQYPRSVVIRMYWDHADQPAVEAPLGDFFAVGLGEKRELTSAPVAISSNGRAYNCYWPMPFRKHARITVSNDSPTLAVGSLYWYVDYEKVRSLPDEAAYFHAQYRQEYPTTPGKNYLLLDTEGRGQYVGTVLSVFMRTQGWFGEGDDFFYIDGEAEPSLRGTGSEDYFCDAWGFRELQRPYYGVPIFDGYMLGGKVSAYRWHIPDPVRFSKSLRVEIENKGNMVNTKDDVISGYSPRSDLYSSVAFWYQQGPAKRFAEMPPLEQRLLPGMTIQFEAGHKAMKPTPAETRLNVQDGSYDAGKQVLALFAEPAGKLEVPFSLELPFAGLAELKLTHSWDYGIWKVSLDGEVLPGLDAADLYNATVVGHSYRLGELKLGAGQHVLTFECVGRNPQSKGHYLGVDALRLLSLERFFKPETQPGS